MLDPFVIGLQHRAYSQCKHLVLCIGKRRLDRTGVLHESGNRAVDVRCNLEELAEIAQAIDGRLEQVAQRRVRLVEFDTWNAIVRHHSPICSRYHL